VKIFANENLFEPIIDYLRSLGHDVLSIRDAGLSGISDDEVYQRACKENRVIVTMDKDFSRMFRFAPEKCGGIIVVKIYKHTVNETLPHSISKCNTRRSDFKWCFKAQTLSGAIIDQ